MPKICTSDDMSNCGGCGGNCGGSCYDSMSSRSYNKKCSSSCNSSKFQSMIMPMNNVLGQYSNIPGSVEFVMRRKNNVVTLQWEPFIGSLAQSGIKFVSAVQSITNLPPYLIKFPIYIKYNDVGRITHVEIDPHAGQNNINFYLNTDGSATGINMGDTVTIMASAVSWIVEC